ncbi:hypothetical protein FYK55_06685 [Roseiconus nitratireducens]|uniref:Uncharacterized protein n=1 Tax=Roseiconus nitratireducens TaxID=2605748 RepID=A0A5M6DG06_9BACT|nr:hypothetical protein [Roseiconus nitratireducens]KAA5545336.1 hypothetical protein FYK55_06685 [Roseiconus nitratireducens]
MWLTAPNRIGVAAWQTRDSIWMIDARGGKDGIRFRLGDESVALIASGDEPLPVLDEQFFRGDELHLSFPQDGGGADFGFRLMIRPILGPDIPIDSQRALFEWVVSIETSLLDTHPTMDLVAPASRGCRRLKVDDPQGGVHLAESPAGETTVLLGPADAPFTSVIDQPDTLRLRLFGEFLEKGVIRRARPWVIFNRMQQPISEAARKATWQALADSPVPLT